VLLKSADELKSFSKGEEELLEGQIKEIKEAGVSVVVSGEFYFCLELIDWFRFSNNWFALCMCRLSFGAMLSFATAGSHGSLQAASLVTWRCTF
jgi:hypothetical protein